MESFDLDNHRVVQQPVHQRGGDDRIDQDFASLGKAVIGREDHGALFIAGVNKLGERVGTAGFDR